MIVSPQGKSSPLAREVERDRLLLDGRRNVESQPANGLEKIGAEVQAREALTSLVADSPNLFDPGLEASPVRERDFVARWG